MSAAPLITLTSDFGEGSSYVAQMKGVLLAALPNARLVDVCHSLPPQDLRAAALLLRDTAWAFPVGTCHLVVVDPGVGSERRGIAVRARGQCFVGPDNGILDVAIAVAGAEVVELDKPHLFRQPVAATFHGRDIFAPVTAELAAGLTLLDVGTPVTDPVAGVLAACRVEDGQIHGEILGADSFGNLLSNIHRHDLGAEPREARLNGASAQWVNTYSEGPPDTLLALYGSGGYLEFAIRDGSAARYTGALAGAQVLARNA